MRPALLAVVALSFAPWGHCQTESEFERETAQWRATREERLRAENGWLTLVGRYPLADGENRIGTDRDNDIVFPESLEGVGPGRLGVVVVDREANRVTLRLAEGVSMTSNGKPFTGERILGTSTVERDWVSLGRMSLHIIDREGRHFLRLADNESPLRKNFTGCAWYPASKEYAVEARFVPYPQERSLAIVNIVGETTNSPCPGYVEFAIGGQTHRLDAIAEGKGLFLVFRDATAGDTTYGAARFIDIAETPPPNSTFTLDFNRAYNPPCAFSEFTTCPLPPPQNVLKVRIEAGEKYEAKR